ncbi:MAG TPA: hypothetical protein VFF68_09335 [Anaerolineaceae bacterium]|nr:hypothetical protein [Anaerolineaceae bacterium]
MGAADVIRILLLITVLAQALLAYFYLRTRRLAWHGYLAWGLLALLIPILGPCLVIAGRPGDPREAGAP